jgi:hypothetical protein
MNNMLNSFLKNKIETDYEEDIKNCILEGKDTNEIYIEQTSDDSVFVSCTINGTGLVDVNGNFYKYLLEENSNSDRNISPLFWSINAEKNIILCSGFVIFNDPTALEEELYNLVCTLVDYRFNTGEDSSTHDTPPTDLSALINKI